jgi:AcrR family transcriptional regulator
MTNATTNKHATRSARTRQQFVAAAQQLFAERGIDSVSLNEITVAAGQKNRNALQYHFGNREGLLQAIIDQHAGAVAELRRAYAERAGQADWSAAETSARLLVMPMADYIEDHPEGVYYVRILSQLAAMNSSLINPATTSRLSFRKDDYLKGAMSQALSHLGADESQQRLFLAVSITFHTLADICRASEAEDTAPALQRRAELFDQLVGSIAALLSAPARN